jgi:rare lipoprotein A
MFIKSISTIAAAALLGSSAFASTVKDTMLSSWYGGYFHGRTTANGETYDMYGYTAAHKTLPFGTKLRVCYQGCVDVRINDRGPFIGARELDLSYGAASAIGLTHPGVDYVSFTYL